VNQEITTLIRRFWEKRWWILFPAVIGFCISVGSALVEPDVFEGRAVLLSEYTSPSAGNVRRSEVARTREMLRTVRERIYSDTVLTNLVREHDLFPGVAAKDMEAAVKMTFKSLSVQSKGSGGAIHIRFKYSNGERPSEVAAEVANTVATDLVLSTRNSVSEDTDFYRTFFAEQAAEVSKEVERHRNALMAFNRTHEGALAGDREANRAALDRAQRTLDLIGVREESLRLTVDSLERDVESARDRLLKARIAAGADPELAPRRMEMNALLKQLVVAERTHTLDSETIRTLKSDIKRLQGQIDEFEQAGAQSADEKDPRVLYALNGLDNLVARRDRAVKELNNVESTATKAKETVALCLKRIESSRETAVEHANLKSELSRAQARLTSLQNRVDSAQLDHAFHMRSKNYALNVHQPAIAKNTPVAPDRIRMSLMGLFAGLAIGGGFTLLRVKMDQGVRSKSEVQRLLPGAVFITLPDVQARGSRVTHWIAQLVMAASVLLLAGCGVGALGLSEGWWGDPGMIEILVERAHALLS